MSHRVAVLLADRCQPRKCNQECIKFCPPVRSGVTETIYMGDHGKPIISEELCIGCGICVNKCPFSAIRIIGLPEELEAETVQRYGRNGFRLFRLPVPKEGQCVGILGPNGIGKTTAMRILSGLEIPNLGDYEHDAEWAPALARFRGTELGDYLKTVAQSGGGDADDGHAGTGGGITTAVKPQYVDQIPKAFPGQVVEEMLRQADTQGRWDEVIPQLNISHIMDRTLEQVSGGELQRIAIAATLLKEADVYFFDEPSSYLDIHERLRIARVLRTLAETKRVVVIEHDLAILDFLCDLVHIVYGEEGAYGVMTQARPTRNAVNAYLRGFLEEENIRIRDQAIEFEARPPRKEAEMVELLSFPRLKKTLGGFTLDAQAGAIHHGEVVGVVGPNGTGKTTFVKMLAGVLDADEGEVDVDVRVAYKPQYIKAEFDGTLREMLSVEAPELLSTSGFEYGEIARPLQLHSLLDKKVKRLSGGELQRVAVCLCLVQDAQIFLMDEPSAYLDANQRIQAAKTIRRVMEKQGRSALIIDHDVYFLDLVSDSMMVFGGEAGTNGTCSGPFPLRDGMNRFLAEADVTFRRDNETLRPRINKPGSRLDRQQRELGEYYYAAVDARKQAS